MQPLITYWPATMSPGLSCGRKEYGLPQYGHQPSDSALPSLLDRPTGRPQFQQNRLDSGTTGLGINASSGSMSGTRGISTSPPPSRRTGARVAGFTRSCGSVSAVRNGVSSLSSSSKSGRKIAWVATGRLCADESTIASAAWVLSGCWVIEVWKSNLSFWPFLARMPSLPLTQPAFSRRSTALSTLNSNFVVLERKRSGLLTKLAVARPVRQYMYYSIEA